MRLLGLGNRSLGHGQRAPWRWLVVGAMLVAGALLAEPPAETAARAFRTGQEWRAFVHEVRGPSADVFESLLALLLKGLADLEAQGALSAAELQAARSLRIFGPAAAERATAAQLDVSVVYVLALDPAVEGVSWSLRDWLVRAYGAERGGQLVSQFQACLVEPARPLRGTELLLRYGFSSR